MGSRIKPRQISGVIEVTRSGKGFLIMPEGVEDIPVFRENLGGALSGDVVSVEAQEYRGRLQGRVTEVLERKRSSFVGELVRRPRGLFLKPDDSRVYVEFLIVGGVGSPAGQKAIVDVVSWDADPPQATVRRALGMAGSHDTEMRAILAGRGFDSDFPADVVREADAWYEKPWDETEIASRRDMRGTFTLTIDPDDAKDFDDAISYRTLDNGRTEIGVHIADVSHFVRPGSALDREAVKRGTSVYLVDRTIPMLPHQLSEDLCSLKPEVDRLAFSAIFTLKGMTIEERWFGRTIIRSDRRLTYDQADTILNDAADPLHETLSAIMRYSTELRKRRSDQGAIMFDRDELKPVLDEKKVVVGFRRIASTPSHKLIEELMLLANREVASYVKKAIGKKGRTFVYRVHDVPNVEKLEELAIFLRAIGYELTLTAQGATQKEIGRMLKSVKGAPEEDLIKTATIRSMSRAVYTTKNIGHFGLSFQDYTHFTSPIRRYPDLMAHRALAAVLSGTPIHESPQVVEELAVHASEREAEAADAERTSVRLKQVEYMANKIGEERHGTISGVTEWGIYVEDKESGAEGMVRLDTLAGDRYEYHPKKYAVIGARSKHTYRLGDSVTFKATNVDVRERLIDVALVG